MDSLTHIALGACIGQAFAGKQLGKRALFLGALAQSTPDIDFIAAFFTTTAENLLAHRGFTHSILFVLISAPLLALIAERVHRPHNISLKKWVLFFGVQAFVHLLLDGMNVYGVGWFEPFSHYRVSYNWIFVVDPFYSVWLGIGFFMLLVLKRNNTKRMWWVRFGVGLSTLYLLYCGINKFIIDRNVKTIFKNQHIAYNNYFTTPTPLNNWLWYIVAANDSGYHIGYISLFDKSKKIDFTFIPQNKYLLHPYENNEDLQKLIRFSKQFYAVENRNDSIVFNDLRFGQVIGWKNPSAPFSFYYYLQQPNANDFVVQRGRFAAWNYDAFLVLCKRIQGN